MSGELYTWGRSFFGVLGNGTTTPDVLTPTQIGVDTTWDKILCISRTVIALKSDGTLWTWGTAGAGALGNGTTTPDVLTPTQIGSDTDWADVAVSGQFSVLALKDDGTLWGWGSNAGYELGDGTNTQRNSPVQIGSDTDWSRISLGYDHAAVLKTGGSLWVWGNNFEGECAIGSTGGQVTTPAQVGVATWTRVACGTNFTYALKSDGTLWSCGDNPSGVLGQGDTSPRNTLTQVGSDTDWADVRCGEQHVLALKTDGTLWACGENSAGAVGDGTTTDRHSFVQIGSDTDWARVEAGNWHSAAVKDDGSVYTWGEAAFGGLGNSTSTPNVLSPALVYSGGTATVVSLGLSFGALIDAVGAPPPDPNEFWTAFVGTSEIIP